MIENNREEEETNEANEETRRIHIDNLFDDVQYCENKIDCRRTQQMDYFEEESFDSVQCKNPDIMCDNCMGNEQVSSRIIISLYSSFFIYFL